MNHNWLHNPVRYSTEEMNENSETSAVLTLQIPADLLVHRQLRAAALGGSCYDY